MSLALINRRLYMTTRGTYLFEAGYALGRRPVWPQPNRRVVQT